MKALFETIMVLAFWFVGSSASAYAQSTSKIFLNDADRARYNENVVGLVTGSPGGKYMPLGADMARVFDERGRRGLRIVVSVGYGSVQNIDDLLNLKGIDLAIVQADVLDAFRRDPSTYEQLRRKMRYLTRLHREEIHILARGRVPNLAALDRKRISVGLPGSGTRITARLLFERIGIKPIESETGPDEARAQLIAGEIDAMVFVVGRGAAQFKSISGAQSMEAHLNFVPFGSGEADAAPYEASVLSSEDYPSLIAPGSSVAVGAVPSVLAVFAWEPNQPRYKPVRQFAEHLFGRIGDLVRRPGTERGLWCQVDLAAPVAGWERFSVATEWLARNRERPTRVCDETADRDRACYEAFLRDPAPGIRIEDPTSPVAATLYASWRKGHAECPPSLLP
ncbi:TRAP transporter TAXI family solute receptor [Methylorubrum rhodinum]|uniref:TRAP transporter TAXI family solute receptor n=1 Tax=Methylorubrum rhodinum TaxID=29428 RepID=A0A840ZLY7_9HYPH|nr:TAXI family TRAP transporter solute-binding subunit [Methylorubrum rhodinum]MBB5758330.1 TRAP transporter TAXI family solute receptor [Methylorubrum rhodinum]